MGRLPVILPYLSCSVARGGWAAAMPKAGSSDVSGRTSKCTWSGIRLLSPHRVPAPPLPVGHQPQLSAGVVITEGRRLTAIAPLCHMMRIGRRHNSCDPRHESHGNAREYPCQGGIGDLAPLFLRQDDEAGHVGAGAVGEELLEGLEGVEQLAVVGVIL